MDTNFRHAGAFFNFVTSKFSSLFDDSKLTQFCINKPEIFVQELEKLKIKMMLQYEGSTSNEYFYSFHMITLKLKSNLENEFNEIEKKLPKNDLYMIYPDFTHVDYMWDFFCKALHRNNRLFQDLEPNSKLPKINTGKIQADPSFKFVKYSEHKKHDKPQSLRLASLADKRKINIINKNVYIYPSLTGVPMMIEVLVLLHRSNIIIDLLSKGYKVSIILPGISAESTKYRSLDIYTLSNKIKVNLGFTDKYYFE